MIKIAHSSDTHVRNLKYLKQYKIVFDQMYKKLREEEVDIIVHCGDLAHTKTNLSPEYFDVASDFLKNLADIAPLVIIPGNHDGNLRTSTRQDAITPIVKALNHSNIHYLKQSGEFVLGSVCFNVLSVFDTDNWVKPSDDSKINIALYHGAVSGCETDLGWKMDNADHDLVIFKGHDYAMLGDIHKTNQELDIEGRVRYCGSTLQQNFAETDDKGFLIWEIEDKDKFDVRMCSFKNPKPFVTIELTPSGRLPKNITAPQGARIRVVANARLPYDKIRRATEAVKTRFRPESVTYLNRYKGQAFVNENQLLIEKNLRDIAVQESFIKDYLKDYEPSEELLREVYRLNTRLNREAEEKEDVVRNVNWAIKKLEWNNLFNYGENNSVDFDKLSGTAGIFGKNFSGKSSIVDSMLYTLFNSTSKNIRKNVNIINQNKDKGSGKVTIQVGEKLYTIERISEKYERKLHGEVTIEARTDVKFVVKDLVTGEEETLDGIDRKATDAAIRRTFGTLEDFLVTSMSSQMGAMNFINEGSTRRKELLAKFLDLEFFDTKFKLAKNECAEVKAILRRMESVDYTTEESEAQIEFDKVKENLVLKRQECRDIEGKIINKATELRNIKEALEAIPDRIINPKKVKEKIGAKKKSVERCENRNEALRLEIENQQLFIEKSEETLDSMCLEELIKRRENFALKREELGKVLVEIKKGETELIHLKRSAKILDSVPCGDVYAQSCRFIKNAFLAKSQIKDVDLAIGGKKKIAKAAEETLTDDNMDNVISQYRNLILKVSEAKTKISRNKLFLEKNKKELATRHEEIQDLQAEFDYYKEHKDTIDNAERLMWQQTLCATQKIKLEDSLVECTEKIFELVKGEGSLQQKVENIREKKTELVALQTEFSAYDLFMKCFHSSGIAFDIIKKKLPFINEAISEILANVVDFEVFFEERGNKLDINIKHPRYPHRPLELGSGAEKTLAAMAIRIALLNVSNMPKPDVFILDEPGTALDADNMEGFTRILEILKEHFKTTLLITHIDNLKDSVDTTIDIIKSEEGYAYVNQ